MALINCSECGKEISDTVKVCPYCGFPIKKQKKKSAKIIIIVGILLIFVMLSCIIVSFNRLNEAEKEDVSSVCNAISEIGNVNRSSDADIENAEELYDSLSQKCKRHVKNYNELVKARETYDQLKADDTIRLISLIGKVTLNSKSTIDKAQESYDLLTDGQKKLVNNVDELTNAKKQILELRIDFVSEKIQQIGDVTLDSHINIETARKSYDKLSDDEKNKVSNYNDLTAAEEKYNTLAVEKCMLLIDDIGKVTLKSKDKINKAEKLYNSLSNKSQENVLNYDMLKKASNKYERLKKQEENRKRTLKSGSKFKTSKWEIVYKNTNISAKIYPNNTSGYYTYYYADNDKTFIDIVFQVKNIDTDILGIEELVSDCKVKYNNKNLTKNFDMYASNGSQIKKIYSWDGLDALDSITLHVVITMPREIQSNKKSITVNLTVAGEEKIIYVR